MLKFTQVIVEPTRITDTSSTLIDHMIVSRHEIYHTHGTLDVSLSDHSLNFVIRKKYKPSKDKGYIWTRSYRKYDARTFRNRISMVNWKLVLESRTVDYAVKDLYNLFLLILD